jgi:hypothetical protein
MNVHALLSFVQKKRNLPNICTQPFPIPLEPPVIIVTLSAYLCGAAMFISHMITLQW